MDCIFCSIADNKIPAEKVYEDAYVVAFKDVNPLAKVHIVVIPKECRLHFHNLEDDILVSMMRAIKTIIKEQNLAETGYRLVNNNGSDGGQTVPHVHFHILGGEPLGDNFAG